MYKGYDVIFDYLPAALKENIIEAIRTRCTTGIYTEHNIFDFTHLWDSNKGFILLCGNTSRNTFKELIVHDWILHVEQTFKIFYSSLRNFVVSFDPHVPVIFNSMQVQSSSFISKHTVKIASVVVAFLKPFYL